MAGTPLASQTVGPFFSIGLHPFLRRDLFGGNASSEHVTVRGRVLDGDRQPVPDAVLEIWQPGEVNARATGPDGYPVGFGRVATNDHGEFEFSLNKPVQSESDGVTHAPHVAVLIFMRGLLRHLVTRMYFPDEAANALDPVLQLVPEDRRITLIAKSAEEPGAVVWDIHLQSDHETVFFDF